MRFNFLEYSFDIPKEMIDDYQKDFEVLRDPNMREDLDVMRDSIYTMMCLVESHPKLITKDKYIREFAEALAMKEALFNLNLLHDS
jgi:hypothetical protein